MNLLGQSPHSRRKNHAFRRNRQKLGARSLPISGIVRVKTEYPRPLVRAAGFFYYSMNDPAQFRIGELPGDSHRLR